MKQKRQHLSVPFKIKQLPDNDDKFFNFEGFASTFGNIDLGNDIVQQGAFRDSLKKTPQVPILWQHGIREPIGKSIHLEEQTKGLFVRGILPKNDSLVRDRVIPQIQVGSIDTMSIGFFTKEFSFNDDTNIATLEKIDLFEISLVTLAMNPQAVITDFKSFGHKDFKSLRDIETFLKKGGLSNTESKTLISKIKEFSNQRDVDNDDKDEQRDVAQKLDQILVLHSDQKLNQIINNLTVKSND